MFFSRLKFFIFFFIVMVGNCTVPDITNGDVTTIDDGLHEGVEIAIECDIGYTLTGPDNVTCHNLQWTPEVSECLGQQDILLVVTLISSFLLGLCLCM